jgi:hypothetical protein
VCQRYLAEFSRANCSHLRMLQPLVGAHELSLSAAPAAEPPLPNRETAFFTRRLPHRGQQISCTADIERRNFSNSSPHSPQRYS